MNRIPEALNYSAELDKNGKDPALKGIYVRRCKCGGRPYYDRIATYPTPQWIKCNCGREGESALTAKQAIDNWNSGKITSNP